MTKKNEGPARPLSPSAHTVAPTSSLAELLLQRMTAEATRALQVSCAPGEGTGVTIGRALIAALAASSEQLALLWLFIEGGARPVGVEAIEGWLRERYAELDAVRSVEVPRG